MPRIGVSGAGRGASGIWDGRGVGRGRISRLRLVSVAWLHGRWILRNEGIFTGFDEFGVLGLVRIYHRVPLLFFSCFALVCRIHILFIQPTVGDEMTYRMNTGSTFSVVSECGSLMGGGGGGGGASCLVLMRVLWCRAGMEMEPGLESVMTDGKVDGDVLLRDLRAEACGLPGGEISPSHRAWRPSQRFWINRATAITNHHLKNHPPKHTPKAQGVSQISKVYLNTTPPTPSNSPKPKASSA